MFGTDKALALKISRDGNIIWSKRAGGNSADYARKIQIDGSGNIILVGHFISMNVTFGSTTLSSLGGNDILILKYDNLGNIVWAKSSGGAQFDYTTGVDIDMYNNIYVGGWFASTSITLDTITLNNTDTFGNTYDCFVSKIDSSGNIVFSKARTIRSRRAGPSTDQSCPPCKLGTGQST
jgi:hypothetical protein